MPEIFHTSPVSATAQSAPLVIHCSDPRYQPHFQDFLRNTLSLERYALIAVPGGVHFLVERDSAPRFSWVGRSWVEFVCKVAQAERVILIGHDDCRWYLDMRFGHEPAPLRSRITEDLHRVRAALIERFPHLGAELYFARLEGDRAAIESV